MQATETFERGGRILAAWLPDLVSLDPSTRQAAGDAVAAMFYGVSSVHDELSACPDAEPQEATWRKAVRDAIQSQGFPRRSFFLSAAARLVGAHDDYMRQITQGDPQFENICDRIGGRLNATTDEQERARELQRLGRAMCASIKRVCESETPNFEVTSFSSFALQWVFEAAGPAILEAPEALWILLESRGMPYVAAKALVEIGPPAAPLFLPHFVEKFEATYAGAVFNESSVLASLGRGNREVVDTLLRAIETRGENAAWTAASTLNQMGVEACAHEEAIPALLRSTASTEAQRRAAAAFALGGVARNSDDVIPRLLELTLDQSSNDYGGHIVAGCAATALGRIGRQADRVVPRLTEMFATFREYDPDMEYGGRDARLAEALMRFGPAAAAVTPAVVARLEQYLDADEDLEEACSGELLQLLRVIGPPAREALPVLRRLLDAVMEARRTAAAASDKEDDDIENEDEVSSDDNGIDDDNIAVADLRRTIRALGGTDASAN